LNGLFFGKESDTSQTQARFTTLIFSNPDRQLAKIDCSNAILVVKMGDAGRAQALRKKPDKLAVGPGVCRMLG
jgi:hypothetical protein